MKIKNITFCGITTALLCVLAPVAIPVSGIPITLTTLVIYIIGNVLSPTVSITSVVLYIILGCVGLPVFSGFSGGITHLLGPGGGFILGYIPLILCVSMLNKSIFRQIIGILLGTLLLYLCGCIGYMIYSKSEITTVFSVCVIPFLPGDICKFLLTLITIPRIKNMIQNNTDF